MDADKVKTFTEQTGTPVPDSPQLMSRESVDFLVKMMLDEIMELYCTVDDTTDYKYKMIEMIVNAKNLPKTNLSTPETIAEQADALVDCYYYSLNAAAKHGVNLSKIFNLVHDANMNKRDPESGLFKKREDGKVIKPYGWMPPDVVGLIKSHMKDGSWA